eukprot:7383351-Prymnesium_polylepis.2
MGGVTMASRAHQSTPTGSTLNLQPGLLQRKGNTINAPPVAFEVKVCQSLTAPVPTAACAYMTRHLTDGRHVLAISPQLTVKDAELTGSTFGGSTLSAGASTIFGPELALGAALPSLFWAMTRYS